MTWVSRGADSALLALAVSLPFETTGAAFSLGGLRFTSVEIMLGVALAAGGVALVADPGRRARLRSAMPPSWALLLGAFAVSALVSALAAPAFGGTALKAAARSWGGLALVPVALAAVQTRRDLGRIAGAIAAGAAVTALIGLTEVVSGNTFGWLRHFRVAETYVGPIRRLSGTFDQANIAAMFLEASLPLLAVLVWAAWRRRRTLLAAAGLALAVALLEALILTYSRAGIVSLLVSNLVVAALVVIGRRKPIPRAVASVSALAVLAAVVVAINIAASSSVRTGLDRDSIHDRYRSETGMSAPSMLPRDKLWRAAFDLFRERPLVGIGLDTFRLSYGRELGLRRWNTTEHSNSLYVETLVSLGIVGGLAFFGWLAVLAIDIVRTLLRAVDVWQATIAASLIAYLVHGLLDYFLLFSATGLLFWLLCGLWLAARRAPA
jgi:O-antigen ligase